MATYTDLTSRIRKLNSRIGGNWEPQFQLLWVLEELGEVSKEFLKLQNLPAKDKSDDALRQELKLEIGDVMYGLSSFCNSLGIDLLTCLEKSVEKFEVRHE